MYISSPVTIVSWSILPARAFYSSSTTIPNLAAKLPQNLLELSGLDWREISEIGATD